MTEINPPGWLQALSTHTAEQMRSYLGALLALGSGAASLKTLGGVHPALGGQFAVAQNGTPNMSVNVSAGLAFITGTETTKQGTYFIENDATVNKTIATSDPTNPRIDIVVAKVQDATYSGGTNSWSLAVVTGTPAGSPTPPAAPVNSITLAQVAVAANATTIVTGNITDKRPYAGAIGAALLCTSTTRPASGIYDGMLVNETDTDKLARYNGTNWHYIGETICTAATRPAGPFTGQRIYETDTGLSYRWNGSKWIRDQQELPISGQYSSTGTGFTDVTGFSFTGDTSSVYRFDSWLHTVAPTANDLSLQWVLPASATMEWTLLGPAGTDGGTTVVTTMYQGAVTTTGPLTIGGMNSVGTTGRVMGTITIAGTSGTCKIQGAQLVAGGTSFIRASSWLYVKQIS